MASIARPQGTLQRTRQTEALHGQRLVQSLPGPLVALVPEPELTRSVGPEPRIVPGVKPWTHGKARRTAGCEFFRPTGHLASADRSSTAGSPW